jgi:hypothetical protein
MRSSSGEVAEAPRFQKIVARREAVIDPTQDPAASPMNVLLNWQAPAGRK